MAVPDLLLKVRVIGKFLGYLVFLPYWSQFGGPQPRVNRSLVCGPSCTAFSLIIALHILYMHVMSLTVVFCFLFLLRSSPSISPGLWMSCSVSRRLVLRGTCALLFPGLFSTSV